MATGTQDQQHKKLTPKEQLFVVYYCDSWNATKAARLAGYKDGPGLRVTASRLLTKANIQAAIKERISDIAMEKDEALSRLAQQARNDAAQYITVHHAMTPDTALALGALLRNGILMLIGDPLQPEAAQLMLVESDEVEEFCSKSAINRLIVEVLRARKDRRATRAQLVEALADTTAVQPRAAFDIEACVNEGREHLIKKLKYDSSGNLEVELHDAQAALTQVLRTHGAFVDNMNHSGEVKTGLTGDDLVALFNAAPQDLAEWRAKRFGSSSNPNA